MPKPSSPSPKNVLAVALHWVVTILDLTKNDTEESFLANRERQLAVERCFTALGEALKDLPDELLAKEPDIPWEKSKGFRDIIAHDYWGGLMQPQIWDTIKAYLPDLKAALDRLHRIN